jgi:hypothetical protein
MRAILLCVVACAVAAGCNRGHSATPAVSSAQAGKVFLRAKGPDREVQRFRKIWAIALEDHDLTSVDTADVADAIVKAEVIQEESTHDLYAPLVRVVLTSRKGENFVFQSCTTVSTSQDVYEEPVTRINLPSNWKKEHPAISALYIDQAGFKDSKNLVQLLIDPLQKQGYRLVSNLSEADAQLSSIKVERLAIPMRTVDRGVHYEVSDKSSRRFAYSDSGMGSIAYMGPRDLIDPHLPCSISTFGDGGERYWSEATHIAKMIQEHLTQTTAKSK